MNNRQEHQFQRIIISVDDLNRQVWGSIYQFIEHYYMYRELKDFGLDVYWADTTKEDSRTDNSKNTVQFNHKSKIDLGNTNVRLDHQALFGILYNKKDGNDDFDHIASFLLLEKNYSDKILLGINLNNIEYQEANNYKFRLAAFCCLSNSKSIRILLKDTIVNQETGVVTQINEQKVIPSEDVARTYLPLCKITKSTYNQLFVKPINETQEIIGENEAAQKVILYIQESIIKLEKDFNKAYLKRFDKHYTTLFDKWFILAYFYSIGTPYTDKRLKSEATNENEDDDLVIALKNFTNNIQELSQNIIYHTNDKEGYLYVAFIKKGDLSKNALEKNNAFAAIDTNVKRFVEFGVMDKAKKGIVPTFQKRLDNKEKLELINFFELKPTKTINLTSLDMRYAAHLGLKTFVASIKGQGGYFYVESNSNDHTKSKVELCNGDLNEISSPNFVDGTHFHVIVPVSKIELIPAPESQSSAESFIQQFKGIIEKSTKKKATKIKISRTALSSILRLSNTTDIEERNKEIKELGDKIAEEKYSNDEIEREIAIEIPDNDGSLYIVQNVYRLINYLQLSLNNNYLTTIVLTNLSEEFVDVFWNLFKTHVIEANLSPIWKNDCAIVLMSKNLNYRIISGEEKTDIYALNNEFKKHYCISTNFPLSELTTLKNELKCFVRPYELLIDNNKYFYSYVDQLLRKCIENKDQGYCVRHENTYIGSKMIVVNYYEAETLFQNSFFAERFAFLIAKKLQRERIDIDENWYIVGAGYHSDLILRSLQSILSNKPKTMLAIDGDEIDFHCSSQEPNQESKFIIITPIGSTLSYHDKIAAFLMRKFNVEKDKMIHHCVMVVGNKNNTNYIKKQKGSCVFFTGIDEQNADIEYYFKWDYINVIDNSIHLKYKNVEKVDYYILIGQRNEIEDKNNWYHRINNCITYPQNYADEKYVNRTENLSINSQNLLGFPKLRDTYLDSSKHDANSSKHGAELKNLKELIQYFYYGHIENHHTHYRYYIHSEKFVAKEKINKNSCLTKWISGLKKEQFFQKFVGCLNIIITPNARIESEFVNYINQEVFGNNAQIINIDAHSWKNNMAHKYKYISDIVINNSKVRFHYVDHALFTANTFLKTKSFFEEIISSKDNDIFSSIIVLINRVSPNVTDNIANNPYFHAFLNLYIPESTDSINDCVLCALVEFYKLFHDRTISSDCCEIIEKNENKIKKTTFEELKKKKNPIDDKKQLRLLFTHELFYRIAEVNGSQNLSSFEKYKLAKNNLDKFYSKEINTFCEQWSNKTYNQIDKIISFVKVISSPPLTRFIAVREYAHFKLLDILKNLLEKQTEICSFDDLRLLKAVLKSLSFLNSTSLVRKTVILGSWKIYNDVFANVFHELGLNRTKDLFNEALVYKENDKIDLLVKTEPMDLFSQDELLNKKELLNDLWNNYKTFSKELYFYIKNAILDDETKSMFLNELLRTGEECLTMEMLKKNITKKADFKVMINVGSVFCNEVKQQYEHFLKWLYYDTTTVLQKTLTNFEKETIKDECIKKSFYSDCNDKNPQKWVLADYQTALVENTIQNFKDKVVGEGNKVEYYYENLKLYDFNTKGINYVDKLVRVLYAKLKLERLVDSEIDNSQTKVEDDVTDVLTVLSDIMETVRTFIIFKRDEQAYYEFAVGDYGRCGRVDDGDQFVKDFSNINPFESAQKKIQGDEYYCEYTRIDDHSVLYFTYYGGTNKPSNAQKQLLLLLRNNLCRYVKFISNKGLLDVWVEKQRTNEFFTERYRKNTHNALGNLELISSNFFYNKQMTSNPDYVKLYSIMADLHVGEIHNSLLVNEKESYNCIIKDYNEIKERFEHFIECAKQYLRAEEITNVEIEDLSGKKFYYTDNLPFLLFQFIHNIKKNTKSGFQDDVKVSIYTEGDCLVIKNTNSKINVTRFEETKEVLQSEFKNEVLKKSISLYCISYFCKQITGKNLDIDMEKESGAFIVKIPIIKTIN